MWHFVTAATDCAFSKKQIKKKKEMQQMQIFVNKDEQVNLWELNIQNIFF